MLVSLLKKATYNDDGHKEFDVVSAIKFEETKDSKTEAYSLRFPVLKYVYKGGRNV